MTKKSVNRYEIVFSDVDGTLLNSGHKITPLTLEAIKSLENKNISFVIVSARSPSGIYPILDEYKITCPIICYSGALILDKNRRMLFHRGIEKQNAKHIVEYVENSFFDLTYCLYSLDQWIVKDKVDPRIRNEEYIVKAQAEQGDIDSVKDTQINKILCICNPVETLLIEKKLKKEFPDYSIVKSSEMLLEIMEKGINKAAAMKTVCGLWDVDIKNTLAFGDNYNDVEMLLAAGKGYLMANAPEQLKKQINNITADNDHDGIYEGLVQLHVI